MMKNVRNARVGQSKTSAIEKVGWTATGLATLALLGVGAMLSMNLPEIKRYLKLRSM